MNGCLDFTCLPIRHGPHILSQSSQILVNLEQLHTWRFSQYACYLHVLIVDAISQPDLSLHYSTCD